MLKTKIKILYISGSFGNDNGAAVIAYHTAKLFNNEKYENEIYTVRGCSPFIYSKYENLFPNAINSVSKYLRNIIKYYYNFDSQKNIKILLKDYKPDIIHIHGLRNPALTYSILKPIINKKIPVIMTLHDCFLVCPMMTLIRGNGTNCDLINCNGFNKFHCIKNNCGKNIEQSTRLALMSFINKLTNYDKHINKFITPSQALRNLMIKNNKDIDENKIITINNFLSNEEINTIPNYSNNGYFLYIGRLSKEKGVHYLLEAMSTLQKNIKLKIVGTGEEENYLKQYAKENNLNNVEFVGFKNREEIKEYYQNCIATILPCNWFENFPTTNMESFINGKPVIASNIGGIPEQVEHNKTGFLFEPANVEQLKECILTYWNNPELVIEHGKNAYQKAKQTYTANRYYNELSCLYLGVLDEHKF